jgi:hypothetical protein
MKISIRSSPNFGKSFRREIRESTCSPTRFLHYAPEKNGEESCPLGGTHFFVEIVIDFEQRFRLYDRSTRAIKPPSKGGSCSDDFQYEDPSSSDLDGDTPQFLWERCNG